MLPDNFVDRPDNFQDRFKNNFPHSNTQTPVENRGLELEAFSLGVVTAAKGSTQKRILLKDGQSVKDENHKLGIISGRFQNKRVAGLTGLKETIEALDYNQALTLGTAATDTDYRLLTAKALETAKAHGAAEGAIARTKQLITWPATGNYVVMLDHDPEPGKPDLSADELWSELLSLVPELAGIGRLVTVSSSSAIYRKETGECLKPASGHHTYIVVSGDIEQLVSLIKVRGWAAGKSFFKLGKQNADTGVAAVLERHIVDTSVFSPERLVYEAGACFEPNSPLEQRRPAPKLIEGNVLSLDNLPDPTADELAIAARNKARAKAEIQGERIETAVQAIAATGHSEPRKEAHRRLQNADKGILEDDHILYLTDGGTLRAGDISAAHDGLLLLDPQEPDYRGGAQVARLYWNDGKGWVIHSHAHQGTSYTAARVTQSCVETEQQRIDRLSTYFRSKNPEFYGMTGDRTVINQRYVSLELPAPGSMLAVSSDVSTGKTEALKQLKKQFFDRHPDGYFDEQGYRNGLLRQKAERNGGDHIRDLECSDSRFSQGAIDESRDLLYCLDSLNRRAPALMAAIASGKTALISLDEADAVVKHLAGGGTLGTRQAETWIAWCELMRAVVDGGGYVVAMEADLSQISINAIAEAAGKPPIVAVENTFKPHQGREVINHIALNDEGKESDNLLAKLCHITVINEALGINREIELIAEMSANNSGHLDFVPSRKNKRVFLATDSQRLGRQIEAGAKKHGLKVLRVDRETSELIEVQAFLKNPDSELQTHQYDIVAITTTAESGLSISEGYFDYVALYGSHLENRALKQLAARVRGNIPLHTFIRNRAIAVGEDPDSFTADGVLKAHQKNKQDSAIAAGVAGHFGADILMRAGEALGSAEAVSLHKWQATFAARKNLSGAFLRANTLHLFKQSGHIITEQVSDSFFSDDEDDYLEARAAVDDEKTSEYVSCPTDKSVSWAAQKLSANGSTYLESIEAQKILDADAWPGLAFNDPKFVKSEIIQKRRQGLKAHTFAWLCDNPKIAKLIDLKSWKTQLDQPFIVVSALRRESAKVQILAQSALTEISKLDSYSEETQLIVEVATWAKDRADTLGRLFRLQIRSQHTNIQVVNKLLRKIGYVSKKGKRLGSDGDRSTLWTAEPMPYKDEVFEALNRKWEKELATEIIEIEGTQDSTSPTRNKETLIRVSDVNLNIAIEQAHRRPIPIPDKPAIAAQLVTAGRFETQTADPLADDYYDSSAWGSI